MFGPMLRCLLLAASLVALAACTSATPEQRWLADTSAALGGRDQLASLKTLVLEGDGAMWNVGQDMTIDATGQTFAVSGYRRAIDVEGRRMRVQQTRTPNFLYFQGQAPQTQVFGIDGDAAYTVGANGSPTRTGAATARDRQAELFHHPLVLVAAAAQGKASVANVRTEDNEQLADITPNGSTTAFTIVSDTATHVPSRIRSRAAHPNLGDVIVETRFTEYADGPPGLKSPRRLAAFIDRFKSSELRLTKVDSADPGDVAAPEAVRAAAVPTPPAPSVVAEAVAPGVWFLAGQSHHSVLIEFGDHLMLVEAPQSEARSLAAIAKARELVPGKPLTQLVSSHFHFDHSAGLRAAVAEGLTVITQRDNVDYYEEAAKRPFTIEPDALARNSRSITVEGVDDGRVIEDKTRRVELYHISGNPHADTLLMVYLPKERVLIEADAFSPGASVQPYAPNLLEQIRARKLQVDRIVPLHGTIAPFKDLVAAVPAS